MQVPEVGRMELLRRSSKILMPDLMGHHLPASGSSGAASANGEANMEESDFWYAKCAVLMLVKRRERGGHGGG